MSGLGAEPPLRPEVTPSDDGAATSPRDTADRAPVHAAVRRAIATSGLDATDVGGEPADGPQYRVQAERTVGLLASALARLHSVPPSGDAVALSPDDVVVAARRRAASQPDATRSDAYAHMATERLLDVLAERSELAAARARPPALTHGAATLAQLRADRGELLGFVDWSSAAFADPTRDLAVAARHVHSTFGPSFVPVLFERYGDDAGGVVVDAVLLDWWSLAAELCA